MKVKTGSEKVNKLMERVFPGGLTTIGWVGVMVVVTLSWVA